ncbi:MAG: hypothetical protein IJY46_02210, partial [Lentisphaeria bacterium]|nr:hypothetical protein [Lentisphaeria bacterium]
SRHEQSASCGMPQSEVSGKSTATAECEARAARRLTRRRREIFWRKAAAGQSSHELDRRQYRAANVSFFKAKLRECTTVLDRS